ncbi:MFS transporter [Actinoplanes sp. GCM10030250]|uniref:MFS transporter n=1 Tax=Actinoplanes sp. GCM10030250 TaxID=3273376 RepID=UPI0036083BA0
MTESRSPSAGLTRPDILDKYPRRWWALVFIALAQLMIALDTNVVTIALPSAQHDLGVSDVDRQWIITGYTVAFGGLLLLGGRIADRYGRKITLMTGVLGFVVASIAGGLAQDGTTLISARIAQGVFAALLAPSTLALINTIFTDRAERSRAIGVYSAVLVAGGLLGLVGGGIITSYLDWRWCMFVNVPIALVVAAGAAVTLPNPVARPDVRVDVVSAITGCGGVVALVYGFTEAGEHGWGGSRVTVPLVAACLLIVAFVLLQGRVRTPLLPLRIFADRNRATAYASVALASVGLFAVFLFLTYQFQIVMGYSPLRTGVALLPLTVANIVAAILVGNGIAPKVPPRLIMVPAIISATVALLLMTRVTPHSSYLGLLLPVQILIGLGLGSAFGPAVATATGGVREQDAGIASAAVNTAQQVGASIGTALLNTIAASATTAFLKAHGGGPSIALDAVTHGYARASMWAAVILTLTAVLVAVFVNAPAPGGVVDMATGLLEKKEER